MASPDMDVIKEIPGYKVIMKAIIKSQIQQLVEQLASHTEEESIILTASISDGTLSHLGSDSGKSFLDDHEDVKSQFLGFCLKSHHRKKQREKEREEQERQREEQERQRQMMQQAHAASAARFRAGGMGPRYGSPMGGPRPRFAARQASFTARPMRHEPYPVTKPVKRLSQGESPMKIPIDGQSIKIEPDDEGSNQSAGDKNTSQPGSPGQNVKGENADEDNSSNSNIPNESSEPNFSDTQPAGGLGLDSDLSNLISEHSQADPNVNIKTEAQDQEDELEITGIEPGTPLTPQDTSWGPNTSMGYSPGVSGYSPGAAGSMDDMQGQEGYNKSLPETLQETKSPQKIYACPICPQQFPYPSAFHRHMTTHSVEKPFQCDLCEYSSGRRDALRNHMFNRHNVVTPRQQRKRLT